MIALHRVIDLDAAPALVWRRLWDVPALARCIPGCEGVETVEPERRYRATIRDRVGPFRVAIPLDVRVEPAAPAGPHGEARLDITAAGRDSVVGSPVTVTLAVTVSTRDGGGTRLTLEGQGDVGGKLAALGQGVIERKTRETLDRFATNLSALFIGGQNAAAV